MWKAMIILNTWALHLLTTVCFNDIFTAVFSYYGHSDQIVLKK